MHFCARSDEDSCDTVLVSPPKRDGKKRQNHVGSAVYFVTFKKHVAVFVPFALHVTVVRSNYAELSGRGCVVAIQTVGAAIKIKLCVPSSSPAQNVGIPVWRG